jgi:hypothetical protein
MCNDVVQFQEQSTRRNMIRLCFILEGDANVEVNAT